MGKKEAILFFVRSYFGSVEKKTPCHLEEVCRFKIIKKKEFLFHEAQAGSAVYFLASGKVKLFKTDAEGKEVILHFIESGELFAGLLLLSEGCYPFSAIALEQVELLAINHVELRKMILLSPEFSIRMIETLASRQKFFINNIKYLALSDPRTRFLSYLNYLAKQTGSNVVKLPAAKGDIALLLGITPETLSRLLRRLIDEGIISIHGKKIELHNLPFQHHRSFPLS